MIARVKAMISHLIRSETTERVFLDIEYADTSSRMYKYPFWRERSLRERGLNSLREEDDKYYWYDEIVKLPAGESRFFI